MLSNLKETLSIFLRPVDFVRGYQRGNLRPDLVAGLTIAIVLLPQAIAYALIAELPPEFGLYSAIVAAIVGALWGSSNHLHTGPTNAISLLILSILLPVAEVGSETYLAAVGLIAVMVGVFQIILGLARLGMLVNFVSDSVVIGFTAGAGVLISVNQLRHLLRLDFPSSHGLVTTLQEIAAHISELHLISLALGAGVIVLIALLRRFRPKWPGPLIGMVAAAGMVGLLGLNQQGISVLGELPRGLPPLTKLPLLDFELTSELTSGALAVGAIGLVEALAIARAISSQSGQRLDSNQEFVGQGLANIACGFLSGYTTSGSFTRSGVNYRAGGRTPMASIFSGFFVLVAMLLLAPLATFVPRTALAGVLLVTAYGMVDREEIARIWRGTQGDAIIMVVTFLATLLLPLQFAVLTGILLSFAVYILRTSVPQVIPVLPGEEFKHFSHQPQKSPCPQLAIFDIRGDLYFGAVSHVEKSIQQYLKRHPGQRFVLLRMHSVNQCDISGIHSLESILRICRERGGDLFMVRSQETVMNLIKTTGFHQTLGPQNFLPEDQAISHIFHRVLDPAVCIYECEVRAFLECQNLPKRTLYPEGIPQTTEIPTEKAADVSPQDLWQKLHSQTPPLVVDVREPREYQRGYIPQAQRITFFELICEEPSLPHDRPLVFVCRSGRRSQRVVARFSEHGYSNVRMLRGGMLGWEAAGLLEAVDR